MFDNLSEKLDKALHTLRGHGQITEINVAETTKEVRRALLDADVNFKIAKEFTNRVKEKALGQNVLTTLQPGQLMVKIVKDELTQLMGGESEGIDLSGAPSIILMSGLQGSGKTTFSGKLANFLKTKKSKKPLLVACDVYRPAAIDQLHIVGDQIGVEVYSDKENKNPVAIAQAGIAKAKQDGHKRSHHRYRRSFGGGQKDDGRDIGHPQRHRPTGNPFRGRCHDGAGCREYREGLQRCPEF